jgi:phage FluMu protein Com
MKAGKDLTGRNWPGSLCRFCGYFVPDVLSEHYELKCDGCGKSIGLRGFDRHWRDLDEGDIQTLLAAEKRRADQKKLELDRLVERTKVEKNEVLLQALNDEIARRLDGKLHEVRDFKLPLSWQKRHEELVQNHFCLDCHRGRRLEGKVDFNDVDSHVEREIRCSVCKKVVAHLYIPERHPEAIQEEYLENSSMDCTEGCAAKAREIVAEIRKVLNGNEGKF